MYEDEQNHDLSEEEDSPTDCTSAAIRNRKRGRAIPNGVFQNWNIRDKMKCST